MIAACLVVLSLTAGPRISVPRLVTDPLRPTVVEKLYLVYPVKLRSEKLNGINGFDKASPADITFPCPEALRVAPKVWPYRTSARTSFFTVLHDHLRSPPRFA
jgi:hypothetical protein